MATRVTATQIANEVKAEVATLVAVLKERNEADDERWERLEKLLDEHDRAINDHKDGLSTRMTRAESAIQQYREDRKWALGIVAGLIVTWAAAVMVACQSTGMLPDLLPTPTPDNIAVVTFEATGASGQEIESPTPTATATEMPTPTPTSTPEEIGGGEEMITPTLQPTPTMVTPGAVVITPLPVPNGCQWAAQADSAKGYAYTFTDPNRTGHTYQHVRSGPGTSFSIVNRLDKGVQREVYWKLVMDPFTWLALDIGCQQWVAQLGSLIDNP